MASTVFTVRSTLDSVQEESQSLFAVVSFGPLPLRPSPVCCDRQILTKCVERIRERAKVAAVIGEVEGGGGQKMRRQQALEVAKSKNYDNTRKCCILCTKQVKSKQNEEDRYIRITIPLRRKKCCFLIFQQNSSKLKRVLRPLPSSNYRVSSYLMVKAFFSCLSRPTYNLII
jgi:hypothetical protein